MLYIFSGFLFGMLIPYMARRFAKFMPATMAYALYRLIMPNKKVSAVKRKNNIKYRNLMRKYVIKSLVWGVVTALLTFGVHLCLHSDLLIVLVWILLLLYEIDERMFLLPDILTVPLLIVGFLYSSMLPVEHIGTCSPAFSSAMGALFGYVLPVAASLLMVKKNPDAFGGGDIKLLSAVGAWIGFEYVPFLLLGSSAVFGVLCFVKHERTGAFGPAIVISTLILAFFII